MKLLIVDDQATARYALSTILSDLGGFEVFEAASLEEARRVLARFPVEAALIDLRLSDDVRNRDGFVLIQELKAQSSVVPIVVSSLKDMSEIRTAMRAGAYDYIPKDELCEELIAPVLNELRARSSLEREVAQLRARKAADDPLVTRLVGASPAMEKLRAVVRRVALSDRPALVVGPTGSGKELVVHALHALGASPDAPLLDLNCGAIPESLIESMLFGHERGAFTGADRKQQGYLTSVGRGTLFLDEIAELPMALQTRLLRVLESGVFRAVGSTTEQRFDGRVIAATHADLQERVRAGAFREDLYYRLEVLVVKVPSLDERREDIPALVTHFARRQRRPLRFTREALDALSVLPLKGNVRELRNLVDRLAVFADDDLITAAHLAKVTETGSAHAEQALRQFVRAVLQLPAGNKLDAAEEALVSEALTLSGQNKTAAARLLGVHRKVIERRVERHGGNGNGGNSVPPEEPDQGG